MSETSAKLVVRDGDQPMFHPAYVLHGNGDVIPHAPSNFDDVVAFQLKFGLPVGDHPRHLVADHQHQYVADATVYMAMAMKALKMLRTEYQEDEFYGRVQMMLEELIELIEHAQEANMAGVFDSLIDLVYFAYGTAAMMGLPWQAGWDQVQEANMAKVRVRSHTESVRLNKLDVRKPEGWQPPNITGVLQEAFSAYEDYQRHPRVVGAVAAPGLGRLDGDRRPTPEDGDAARESAGSGRP